jgi:hypothetical protein
MKAPGGRPAGTFGHIDLGGSDISRGACAATGNRADDLGLARRDAHRGEPAHGQPGQVVRRFVLPPVEQETVQGQNRFPGTARVFIVKVRTAYPDDRHAALLAAGSCFTGAGGRAQ